MLVTTFTVMLLLAGCDDDMPDPDTRVTGPTQSPSSAIATAKRWAPLVYFASGEKHFPIDASTFIWHANLVWAVDAACGDNVVAERPNEHDLASKGRFREREHDRWCRGFGKYYDTTEPTRPFGNAELGAEGFYLNTKNEVHEQGSTSAPVYVQYTAGEGDNEGLTAYTYWFFYPWNKAVIPGGGRPGNHEGDWERVTVVTDEDDKPLRVVFSQHLTKCAVAWEDVAGPDGHPIVYSARGSHGSYPKAGSYDIPDVPFADETNTGEPWRTWDHAREVDREQWWGYAGGWGEVGAPVQEVPIAGPLAAVQTGPAGPSPIRDMNAEVFSTTPCPQPLDSDTTPTTTTTEAPPAPTTEDAITRFEQFLHALGNEDVATICEIAAPAAKQAEDQGFGTCEQTFGVVFQMIPPDKREALKTATVDPTAVRVLQPTQVEIPTSAIQATTTFTNDELGDTVLTFQDGNWYITD